jgi:hypothetical protein
MPIYLKIRARATGNETMRRRLRTVVRLLKNPTNVGRKTVEWGYIDRFRSYMEELIKSNSVIGSTMNVAQLRTLIHEEKYLHKMYVLGNLIKYMTLNEGKNEMPNALK